MNRSGQQQAVPPAAVQPQRPVHANEKKLKGKGMRIVTSIMLVLVAVLIALLAGYIGTSRDKSEAEYLKADKFQAVFLNGGQVYFGKIREINDNFVTLDNIYYLRVNEQVQPDANAGQNPQQDISLAKLGCELHGPEDNMVINREQMTFWENLKDDGQVAKAIAEFVKQNPEGQKCTTPAAVTP